VKKRSAVAVTMLATMMAGCSSVPKPPVVDESRKVQANSSTAVELEVCRVQNADLRAELRESRQLADGRSAALAQAFVNQAQRHPAVPTLATAAMPAAQAPVASKARQDAPNLIWTVHFAFNSAALSVPASDLQRIVDAAKGAAYTVVKGRTDGRVESPGESRIAQERTNAMYEVLLRGGVDPRKIALQYQAIGDHVADNSTAEGRAANRRVEVELYRVAPERVVLMAEMADVAGKRYRKPDDPARAE
jgi:outer membrane protein OmpA-like peptidoglycan-associated protein